MRPADRLLFVATGANVLAMACVLWASFGPSDRYDVVLLGVGAGLFISSSLLLWRSLQLRRQR